VVDARVYKQVELSAAFYEVYDGAVYLFQGRPYLCKVGRSVGLCVASVVPKVPLHNKELGPSRSCAVEQTFSERWMQASFSQVQQGHIRAQ
jgi:hypothetical protein